ncbi:hybrid sensor histidine kinase/response regulator [Cognatilysobacter lacus]|uniref:histidine kinase n=1 Tax=Cognatilysobacter lacus TaxID=1643323 RepID=A0A5D8Z4Z1_9GAMM|nr:response regulator [Lysobacter lacus]TZF89710.1 response regulator [Lysobacter lacus]
MIGQIQSNRPILVVDDTNSTRYATVRYLRAAGIDVVEATTGVQALALAPGCGAVVLDVNLPDLDGFEVCRRLRAGTVNTRVPVVHLSAQRMRDEDKIRGLESGADAYLTHPVEPGVLIATINALLRARAAEHAERLSRERFEAVFRTAPVGIALTAADGQVLELNDEMRRILRTGDDAASMPRITALLDALMQRCESCAADGVSAPTAFSPPGFEPALHLNCRLARLDNDTRLVLVADVTGQHQLELDKEVLLQSERDARRDAENASRAKDSFLALLSHELRNPLAPISSAARLLQMAPGDAAVIDRASAVISRQVAHMRDLIDDLMDVSRVTRGLVELEREPLDLRDVVRSAVEQVRPLIDTRGHVLRLDLTHEPLVVLGDRTRLIQVVANLLNNAAKYTPHAGDLCVRLSSHAPSAVVAVSDNGVGMSRELLPHVFDLFTQAERTPDRSQGGLGVGLALVKSVVQLHEGRVEADSAGPGQGSTFTVTLPLSAAVPESIEPGTARDIAARALDILLVDDNEDAGATLAELLRVSGHRVTVCTEALAALERVTERSAPHDVYLLDIGLPGMTGYELARHIRAHANAGPSVFIALTGYGLPSDRLASTQAGFDHHLVKPVEQTVLMQLLAQIAD